MGKERKINSDSNLYLTHRSPLRSPFKSLKMRQCSGYFLSCSDSETFWNIQYLYGFTTFSIQILLTHNNKTLLSKCPGERSDAPRGTEKFFPGGSNSQEHNPWRGTVSAWTQFLNSFSGVCQFAAEAFCTGEIHILYKDRCFLIFHGEMTGRRMWRALRLRRGSNKANSSKLTCIAFLVTRWSIIIVFASEIRKNHNREINP